MGTNFVPFFCFFRYIEFCLGPNIRTEALVFFYQLCYVKNGSNGRRDRAVFWYAFHFLLILRMFFSYVRPVI